MLARVARVLVVSRHGFSSSGCLETLLQVREALHEAGGGKGDVPKIRDDPGDACPLLQR